MVVSISVPAWDIEKSTKLVLSQHRFQPVMHKVAKFTQEVHTWDPESVRMMRSPELVFANYTATKGRMP